MSNNFEMIFNKEINCSASVAFWNYWDQEHLEHIHDGYEKFKIIYEDKDLIFSVREVVLPLIRLKITTPIFMKQLDKNNLIAFGIIFGVLSETKVFINDIGHDKCSIKVTYKFYLNGWQKLLRPLLKYLTKKWFQKVWEEDFVLKTRRQKVLRYNFKDFVGLPKKIKDRTNNDEYILKLPLARPKNSLAPLIKIKREDIEFKN